MDSSSTHIIPDLNSNDGKVMLAALVSLIVVLSFVLALHVYARWFMGQAHRRLRRPTTVVTPMVHLQSHRPQLDDQFQTGLGATDGLDASSIGRLPMFMYKSGVNEAGLECAICLSVFEDDEMGRVLPKCQHCFHVECIDMWLQWRSNCPICRALVASPESPSSTVVDISSEVAVAVQVSVGTTTTMSSETANSVRAHESCGSLEVQIEMPVDSSAEHQVQKNSGAVAHNGCSLKRMLSMNRSEHLRVFPSSSASN